LPDQMKVVNPLTLEIQLAAPPPPYFLHILGLPWVPIFDSTEAKKHATSSDPFAQDWLDKNIAGFGPYRLKSTVPGRRVILEANPNYWGGVRKIKTIIQDGIDDSGSRLQLLLSGTADYAEELTPLQLDRVARHPKTAVTNFTSTRVAFLTMNVTKPPFNTPQLRQAIARAIPYDDILKTVYRGRARRWKTLITPWFQGATDEFWRYDTDLNAARAELAPVKGTQVTLSYVKGFGAGEQIAILVQKGLNAAGLNCQLEGLLRAVADQRKIQGQIDFFVDDSDSPAVPSSLYNLQLYFTTTAFQNALSHYQNPDIDTLVKSLAKNPHLNQQTRIIRIAQKILMRDLPFIPIAYTGTNAAHVKNLTGIRAHEIGLPYWQDFKFK
jgi:peptide/nickel transport system substrate-binding protein